MDSIEILTGKAAVAEGEKTGGEGGFRRPNTTNLGRLVEAANLWADATQQGGIAGMRARTRLAESLTTSDFPYLLGGVFDRTLLTAYQNTSPIWRQFASQVTVQDFRPKQLIDLLGGRGVLDKVGQGAEYPARKTTEAQYELTVGKYGARIGLTFEMLVNDDLDAFRDLPNRLAQGATDTEDYLATSQLVGKTGINTAFFKAGNGNAKDTAALTADSLAAALTAISTRKDSEGRPIVNKAARLVVPPQLEMQARRILTATEIRVTDPDTNTTTVQSNFLAGVVTLVVNPWQTVIDQSATAATTWFLLPDPAGPRPALAVGFLRGHDTPDLRVKADTGNSLGGGAIAAEDGSFDDDTIQYRVRHINGAAPVDPITTYASDGSVSS
jgi:hypothetical protein